MKIMILSLAVCLLCMVGKNDGKTAKWAAETLLGGELKEPFFLGAGIFQPHLPNYALQKYFDWFPLDEIELPEGYLIARKAQQL